MVGVNHLKQIKDSHMNFFSNRIQNVYLEDSKIYCCLFYLIF